MVAEAVVWVDVEGAVRAWVRDYVTGADRRVFYERSEKARLPQIVVFRIGGPDGECLIQFDVLARSKDDAAVLAAELATEADALVRYEHDDVMLHTAVVESSRWFPDPVSREPRYIVDVTFVASSTTPTTGS